MKKETCQSVTAIYEENRHWVYGYFIKKLNQVEIAEDLTQTLWLKFFQVCETVNFKNEKALKAYLRSMANHLVSDYFRTLQKSEKLIQELSELIDESSSEDMIFDTVFSKDPAEYLNQAYEILNEEEKLLILLRYTEKLSSKEIAAVAEISPSLVRMKLSRIYEKLRIELKKIMDEER